MFSTNVHGVVTIHESNSALIGFVSTRFAFLDEHGNEIGNISVFTDGKEPARRIIGKLEAGPPFVKMEV